MNVGIEARGFVFGPSIALAIGAKFVPLRKPNKLPGTFFISATPKSFPIPLHAKLRKELVLNQCVGEVISEAYVLEYGTDRLEMHVGAIEPGERALVIDDLVATGGTLSAAVRLLGRSE